MSFPAGSVSATKENGPKLGSHPRNFNLTDGTCSERHAGHDLGGRTYPNRPKTAIGLVDPFKWATRSVSCGQAFLAKSDDETLDIH